MSNTSASKCSGWNCELVGSLAVIPSVYQAKDNGEPEEVKILVLKLARSRLRTAGKECRRASTCAPDSADQLFLADGDTCGAGCDMGIEGRGAEGGVGCCPNAD